MAAEPVPTLTVYGRASCHLCEEMVEALRVLQGLFLFEISVIDVDMDPDLRRLFGDDVPVLAHQDRELCRHRLDPAGVTDYLAKIS